MAAPAPLERHADVEMFAGADKRLRFTLKNPDGTPLNITGLQEAIWTLARVRSDGLALVSKSLGAGIQIAGDATEGVLIVALVTPDTEDLVGLFRGQLLITLSNGDTGVVAFGFIQIRPVNYVPPLEEL